MKYYLLLLIPAALIMSFCSQNKSEKPRKNIVNLQEGLEKATLGGGCFWCLEAVYERVNGIEDVVSGYAGGSTANPSYKEVGSGKTGHAEVVQIHYNPKLISYDEILEIFWTIHDPTTRNRQGADVGPEYRSIILTHTSEQKQMAEKSINEVGALLWNDPIVTEVKDYEAFYPAENYHQDYYNNNSTQGYCRVVINPKLKKLREKFADRLKEE
jgi:peptide-methionine (S)-S-oxide reductase